MGGSSGASGGSAGATGGAAGDGGGAVPAAPALKETHVIPGGGGHHVSDATISPSNGNVSVLGYGSTGAGYETFIAQLKSGQATELPRRSFTSSAQVFGEGLVEGGNGALFLSGFFAKDVTVGSKTFTDPSGWGGFVTRLTPGSSGDVVDGLAMVGNGNQSFWGNARLGSGVVSVGIVLNGTTLHGQQIITDAAGDAIVSMEFDGQPQGKHAMFSGAGAQRFYDVATDSTPKLFAVGESPAVGPPLQVIGNGTLQLATVVAYDSSLKMLWARGLGSAGDDSFLDVAVNASGTQVVAAGQAKGAVDLGSGAPLPNHGGEDVFVAAFDASGNLTWARTFGGGADDRAYSVAIDGEGDVWVGGSVKSATIDFGPAELAKQGDEDGFLLRLDPSGNVRFASLFGGAGADTMSALAAAGNRVVAVGKFAGKFEFLGAPVAAVSANPNVFDFAVLDLVP